jgi:aldose 1-epimerase
MQPECYTVENEELRLTVSTLGAEAVSLIHKKSGAELLWCGDAAVWGRHAPILFPYTGKLTDGKMMAKGMEYEGGQHGFARDAVHTLTKQEPTRLVLELRADAQTLQRWPYAFLLRSTFELNGCTVRHTLTVENPCEEQLRFGIGYHPAFALPFDEKHTTKDYEIRFDTLESPLCVSAQPNGLLSGKSYYLARNVHSIPLSDSLFDNDSHCMVNLKSHTLALVEKDTGRSVTCDITGYPYVLIWSKATKPLHFLCIEPWHSLPGEEHGPLAWEQRPCTASLAPGESWSTTLATTFRR